jgi:calcineurin-like phosphoesterase family protein
VIIIFWFTSDEHFNHGNIIDHTNRPFWNWKQMNEELIKRFNSRVQPSHTTYHVGDFKFGANGPNTYELTKMLNGNHVFVWGNHDKNNGTNTPLKYAIIKTYGKLILLCHHQEDAIMMMEGNSGIDMAFVGHSHHHWKFKPNLVNVGVDVWDFYPVDAKQILKAYGNWEMGRDIKWPKA